MKKKIIGGIIAAILLVGVVVAFMWFKNKPEVNEATVVKAGNGETLVYATIDRIAGNDIEVTVLSDFERMGGGFPGGEMPEGMMPPGEAEEAQTASYRIPVGTDVITTLGATTTFSHLEEGDTIAILMEENSEAILKIWMIM